MGQNFDMKYSNVWKDSDNVYVLCYINLYVRKYNNESCITHINQNSIPEDTTSLLQFMIIVT